MHSKIKILKSKYQYKKCREYILSIKGFENNPFYLLNLAECYYKDNELYYKSSFKKALEILEKYKFFDEFEKERLNLIALKDAAYSFLRKMIEKEDYNYYEKEILYLLTDDVNIGDIAKELKVNESFVEDIFENLKKIIL